MKKYLSLIILLFLFKSYSQEYVPLLQEGNKWYEKKIEYNFDMPSPLSKTYIVINGEETKNGIVYKKLFSNLYCYTSDSLFPCNPTGNTDVFYKLLREDSNERKVYFYDDATNSEVLLYDFSLNVGNQIPYNFPNHATNSENSPDFVWTINHIIYGGKVFNKIISKTFNKDNYYPNGNNIYEGIGSNLGLLFPPGRPIFEGGNFLECFESVASGKSCDSNFLSSKEILNFKTFDLIYLKNFNSFMVVGKSSENFLLQLFDFSGKLVQEKQIKSNENFQLSNAVKNTIYIYKLNSVNGNFTGKIIIP